jgi:polyhydroxyalkanoate synthesis regulator phasin
VEFGAQVQALYERMRANIITQEEAKRQLDALIEERRVRSKESLDEMHRRLSIAIFTDEDLKDEKEPPPPASSMEH